MATSITITLYSAGTFGFDILPLAVVTPLSWSVAKKVNDVNIATVRVNFQKYGGVDITTGQFIIIEREDIANGMAEYVEFVGMIRKYKVIQGADTIIEFVAVDGMHILQDRLVAWYPDLPGYSTFSSVTYPKASSVLAQLWNTNLGQDSGNPPVVSAALTRRYGTSLNRWADGQVILAQTFATDYDVGSAVNYSCSGENLLTAMQKVADAGGIDFWVDIYNQEYGFFEYTLYAAVNRGVDRTAYVKMSQENNTLGTLDRTVDILNSPSYIIANGTGKNKARIHGGYPAVVPEDLALREAFVNGADNTTVAQLNVIATRRWLQEQRKVQSYNIEVLQSSVYRYGRDYFLGDLVTAVWNGATTLTRKVYGVTLGMDSSGNERVQIDLVAN
jgi:hypothetical protein